MPDDGAAVLDAVDTSIENTDISQGESTQSTDAADGGQPKAEDRADGRKQPDALKKHIAELRREADALTDPVAKKAAQDRIKFLYDTSGKARGYEEQFSTVREAREFKALIESVGGRDGVLQMQAKHSEAKAIDDALSAGDTSVIDKLWQEAPEGMPKLVSPIVDRFERDKPAEYEQFIAPRSIKFLDASGFPSVFDQMASLYEAGKTDEAKALRAKLTEWVIGNRQAAQQQKQVDPEVERLRQQLAERDKKDTDGQVESAYSQVVAHAGPEIDRIAKPIIGKLGFTADENKAFRQAVWNHLQESRNAHADYKTIAPAKQRQGYDKWGEYAKRWTSDNADASIRAVLKMPPWSRIVGTPAPVAAVTKAPGTPNVQQGKEPHPSEIDYSVKGKIAAQKAGFKDLQDMILSGQAPMKAGGIRKWRG